MSGSLYHSLLLSYYFTIRLAEFLQGVLGEWVHELGRRTPVGDCLITCLRWDMV